MTYVNESDIDLLIKMFDENLGEGYMSEQEIHNYIDNEKELFFAARREDGTICGILLFGEEDSKTLSEQTLIPEDDLLKMANGKKLLKCRSICVAKDCQGSGLGRQLLSEAIQIIRKSGRYGLITSLLWEYNGKVPSLKLHEENGYQFIHRLKTPWYYLKNYKCVICKGRCQCDGLQYVLKLS